MAEILMIHRFIKAFHGIQKNNSKWIFLISEMHVLKTFKLYFKINFSLFSSMLIKIEFLIKTTAYFFNMNKTFQKKTDSSWLFFRYFAIKKLELQHLIVTKKISSYLFGFKNSILVVSK